MDPTAFVIPCLLAGVALYALTRRVDVYAALTQGAGEGLAVVAKILPALVGLLTAVYMLRASGAMDALAAALALTSALPERAFVGEYERLFGTVSDEAAEPEKAG